jgi:hypothetical protein
MHSLWETRRAREFSKATAHHQLGAQAEPPARECQEIEVARGDDQDKVQFTRPRLAAHPHRKRSV